MTEILKTKLRNFYTNLQNVTNCLIENKNDLTQTLKTLYKSLNYVKNIFDEKKMKVLEILFEEEAKRAEILKNNANITNFIENFSKIEKLKKNENLKKIRNNEDKENDDQNEYILDQTENFSHIKRNIRKKKNLINLQILDKGENKFKIIQSPYYTEDYSDIKEASVTENEQNSQNNQTEQSDFANNCVVLRGNKLFFHRYVKKFQTLESLIKFNLY